MFESTFLGPLHNVWNPKKMFRKSIVKFLSDFDVSRDIQAYQIKFIAKYTYFMCQYCKNQDQKE